MVRYLGNVRFVVFAVPQFRHFPKGSGDVGAGLGLFPKERRKRPPPPMPERKNKRT